MKHSYSPSQLGWQPFFQQQLTLEEWDHYDIARIVAQHRSTVDLLTTTGKQTLPLIPGMPAMTVGDWILLDTSGKFHRRLERLSLFSRKAAGSKISTQLIAANVDTLFVVCSLNQDFNLNRIERYLALANDTDVEAVVVLSKADCCLDPQQYAQQVQILDPHLMVITVNSLDLNEVRKLEPWCSAGKTVALLGSSGVGKSTLINTLAGGAVQQTGPIRKDDDKGRHTTTGRSIHFLPTGGLLLDTPGMRELQLADCEHGITDTFKEIGELATQCQFSDCQHQHEPGCAVQSAIEAGKLDERRLYNYYKLMREQDRNRATLAEKRAQDRKLGRYYRSVLSDVRRRKKC
ncbi:MAG: ribosome small subunit-dependent GTPase A [Candidatus Thiodiazotropha sp. (ex Codakia rugifera)]|nr:ribosome small subunit-dependent GTPase A [Candidatus Thiodiazotropha sp. (ex Codakia rugifera)]